MDNVLETKDFRVVLNGGKREISSATVPVQVFFSDKIIGKEPSHILVFEQTKEEKDSYYASDLGRRYVSEVEKGIHHIPFYSPGYHRVAVLIIAKPFRYCIERYLERHGKNEYFRSLNWLEIQSGNLPEGIIAAAVCEVLIPRELFAEKPTTWLEKLLWNWVNLFHQDPPRDRCHFRKRYLFAFTAQPIIVTVLGGLNVLGGVVIGSLAMFLGIRPYPIPQTAQKLFLLRQFCLASEAVFDRHRPYRTWRWRYDNPKDTTYMPITGIEILILTGAAWIVIYSSCATGLKLIGLAIDVGIAALWVNRLTDFDLGILNKALSIIARWTINCEQKEKEENRLWLETNLKFPGIKDDEFVVRPRGVVARLVVSLEALKAKYCRPYPQ